MLQLHGQGEAKSVRTFINLQSSFINKGAFLRKIIALVGQILQNGVGKLGISGRGKIHPVHTAADKRNGADYISQRRRRRGSNRNRSKLPASHPSAKSAPITNPSRKRVGGCIS